MPLLQAPDAWLMNCLGQVQVDEMLFFYFFCFALQRRLCRNNGLSIECLSSQSTADDPLRGKQNLLAL